MNVNKSWRIRRPFWGFSVHSISVRGHPDMTGLKIKLWKAYWWKLFLISLFTLKVYLPLVELCYGTTLNINFLESGSTNEWSGLKNLTNQRLWTRYCALPLSWVATTRNSWSAQEDRTPKWWPLIGWNESILEADWSMKVSWF